MAAEMLGGACLSAFLQVAFDRLASQEVVDYLRGNKLSDVLINELKDALSAVNAVLDDAERKQITNKYVKEWLDELEGASYVADDLLDEIATHALQSKLEAGSQKSMTSKLSNSFSISSRSYIRNMKNKMKKIIRRLESLKNRIQELHLIAGMGEKMSSIPRTTSLIDESEVHGRDGDKEDIIHLLLEDDDDGRNKVSVIPIVGMGGIGKTTLAQSVYNDHRVQKHFKLRSWVCVSEEFDICKVTKIVLSRVTGSSFHFYDSTDLDLLQTKLKEELVENKFLIVLDDVWNQNYVNWENLKKPYEHGAQGSKILLTTRNEEVARIMHTVPSYNLGHLSDEDCWQLFAKHAFHNTDYNAYPVLVNIGRKIVKKCKGLPLAAKTLGGLLRSIVDVAEWERILESEIWELPNDKSDILPALMLSYHHLPSHIKRCFAFCSVFPKNYKFQKHQLVSYWMAENLLQQKNRNRRKEDVGDDYFNELVFKSFFQRQSWGQNQEYWFVMHDLVHDLAKFVSRGYSFTFENGKNEDLLDVRHLAVAANLSLQRFGSISKAVHLRSFILLDEYSSFDNLSNEAVNNVILNCRCLRILSLSCCKNLEQLSESVGELKHLRFLDLSWTSIRRLPNSVNKLYNLQTLKLSRCYELTKFPEDMHHLINLRHLDISYCFNLEKMPRQVGELKSLQTLSTFMVGKDNGTKIEELRELSDLHGEISLKNLENVKSATDASEARLMDKKHITRLDLHWRDWPWDTKNVANEREVAENLLPHTNLERLCITGYGGPSFPNWLGDFSFCNIVSIKLKECRNCSSLPPLGQLPSLKYLEIFELADVVSVSAEFFYGISGSSVRKSFASLEFLFFRKMSCWEEWSLIGVENGVVFPRLQELHIEDCDMLHRVDWPDSLPCLTTLRINEFGYERRKVVESMSLPKTPVLREFALGRGKLQVKELPQTVESLDMKGNNGMESVVEAIRKGQTSSLKKLRVVNCSSRIITSLSECLVTTITEIEIMDCTLVFFPLDLFPNLRILDICACKSLECVGVSSSSSDGDGLTLTSLSSIRIMHCEKLKKVLPNQMQNLLPSLASLYIYCCPELDSICPGVGLPSNLKSLSIRDCPKLSANRKAWNLQTLQVLESFIISDEQGGGGVESFPEEGMLPSSLYSLEIYRLPHLKRLDIKGLQQLTSLHTLYITACPQLEKLPQQGLPTSLTHLRIGKCPLLEQRCQRETGKDWHIISHILQVEIW